ncbi:MAG: cation transporter [Verrucomicrobia bacterium]|nr:cation transporter [Verrucomicrobiota bacterium]
MTDRRLNRSLRVTAIGMMVNIVLAATKLTAGLLGHAHALIADGVESFADIFSSLVVWRGLIVSAQPADADHPYGHGKAEPIAAAVVATTLLLAAVWIAVKAGEEILRPHLAPAPFTLAVLFLVVTVKEGLFRYVLREARTVGSTAVHTDAWHHRSDAITSIAAAIGISIALIGGPGYESADDIAAIVAAGIIAWNGWRLLRPAMDELMDASPDLALCAEIRRVAEETSGVAAVEKCLVRKMGYHYFVDMHLEVDPQMTVLRAHEVAHQVKDRVRSQLPMIYDVLVHIEPSRGAAH